MEASTLSHRHLESLATIKYCKYHYAKPGFYFTVVAAVQSLSFVWLFVTPWTAASQASLSSTISWSLLWFMFTESVVLTISSSVVPFSFCPQSFPASGSFPMSQFFASGGQSLWASALASVLSVNIQSWFSLELTGLIFLLCEGHSNIFSSTAIWKHQWAEFEKS